MNIEAKRLLIRAAITTVLVLILIAGIKVNAGTDTQETTPTGTTADTTYTEEPTQEQQTATEPVAITTEEQEPIKETESATEATEPPAPTYTEPTFNANELEMLALVIYQEAGADYISDETRLMVGTVVMNRIAHDEFPDTMYEVITQKRQYGRLHWTGIVWPPRASSPTEAHAVERAYAIAERILNGERAFSADVIFQAEFVQGSEVVAYQTGIYFCR